MLQMNLINFEISLNFPLFQFQNNIHSNGFFKFMFSTILSKDCKGFVYIPRQQMLFIQKLLKMLDCVFVNKCLNKYMYRTSIAFGHRS